MKVLHLFKSYYPDSFGGVEQFIRLLVKGLRSHAVSSSILTLADTRYEQVQKCADSAFVRSAQYFSFHSTPLGWRYGRQYSCLSKSANLVHLNVPYPLADCVYLASGGALPALLTYHSDIVKQKFLYFFYKPLMLRLLRSMRRIVATSPNYVDSSPVLSQFRDKIDVIPLGVEATPCVDPTDPLLRRVREQYGEGYFYFVGVFRYYKGLDCLLAAAKMLPYRFVLSGSGPLYAKIAAEIRQHDARNIVLTGQVSEEEKHCLMHHARAVIFPSHLRSEAFGITLVEGAMHAKPLICCEIGTGTSYVTAQGSNGYVVPPRDPYALARACHDIYLNPERSAAMARNSFDRYNQLFKAEQMVDSYYELYRKLLR